MIYLDNAATTRYKPCKVLTELMKETYRSSNPGRSAYKEALDSAMRVFECREFLSNSLGGGDIIFTKNCTEALNIGIFGLPLFGQVVTTVFEHNSVLRPLHELQSRGKITLKILKPNETGLIQADKLMEALEKPTSLFVINETSNVTGATQNLSELCCLAQKSGARVLVDAAQSMGHTQSDYNYADMVASSGHKGLHGPQGTGFLLLKKDLRLSPILYGGTGTSSLSLKHPGEVPEGLEAGTINTPGIRALNAGAQWTMENFEKINAKIHRLSVMAWELLFEIKKVKLYSQKGSSVILFNIGNLPSVAVADMLSSQYDIGVRAGFHCAPLAHKHLGTATQGGVRISAGYNNSVKDITVLADAVNKIAKDV